MSFSIVGIGVGEGGGRIATSMVDIGINIGCINTNQGDLNGLRQLPDNKKLLLEISGGGSGKDPKFVREALKDVSHKKNIISFVKKLLETTPVYSNCPDCNSKEKLKDVEAIGDIHACSNCGHKYGITNIVKEDNPKHDYLFLFVCLGGGSGSGLIEEIVDICYVNFNLPIAVVCTLPDDTEDTTTKQNAMSIFKILYDKYAVKGTISPLILIDNQKMQENFDLPLGAMYTTINTSVTSLIDKFNKFSNKTSRYMSTVDTMDTARLWSLGGCCSLGRFVVGNTSNKNNIGQINVPHPLDLDKIEQAMKDCTFVDGFDLSSATGVGIIAVAPEHFLQDENVSKCIRYAFGKAKEIIGDGLVFRGQYDSSTTDCLEFYLFYNGLLYPQSRFERMWGDIKEGRVISQRKKNRINEVPYEIGLESNDSGQNFKKLQRLNNDSIEKDEQKQALVEDKPIEWVVCNNCFIDPVSKKSMGVYNKRGPKPFERGICPVCKGRGRIPK